MALKIPKENNVPVFTDSLNRQQNRTYLFKDNITGQIYLANTCFNEKVLPIGGKKADIFKEKCPNRGGGGGGKIGNIKEKYHHSIEQGTFIHILCALLLHLIPCPQKIPVARLT